MYFSQIYPNFNSNCLFMHIPYKGIELGHPKMNWHITKLDIVKIFPFLNPFLQYLNFLTSNIQEVDDPTLVT